MSAISLSHRLHSERLNPSYHRLRSEQSLFFARWLLIALGIGSTLPRTVVPFTLTLSDAILLIAILYNLALGILIYSRKWAPPYINLLTSGVDLLLVTTYLWSSSATIFTSALLYTLLVVTVGLRLSTPGALMAGVISILLNAMLTFLQTNAILPHLLSGSSLLIASLTLLITILLQMERRDRLALAELLATLEKRFADLSLLQEVTQSLHDLRSGTTLQNIVEICTHLMGFRRAALLLTPHTAEYGLPLQYHSSCSEKSTPLPPLTIPPSLFERFTRRHRLFVLKETDPSLPPETPIPLLVIPLHGLEGPLGLLLIDYGNRPNLERYEIEMLRTLGNSAVQAIENIRLHRRVQHLANHDGLTDLYNHRYFQEVLRESLDRARADQRPVSLIMIEIDRFKKYNDTYGHRQGDRALISVAHALADRTRGCEGLAARYGGDEFVLLLPGMDAEEVERFAHELLTWTQDFCKAELAYYGLPPVSLSIGTATFPTDAITASELIDAADQAMYMAKRSGGNRVQTYRQSRSALSAAQTRKEER